MNETIFTNEYGMSLQEALAKLLTKEITVNDVIESDEFAEYIAEHNFTWKDFE